ncbi:DUF6364 family protein [Ammonifex thiophilus]|uniref:CopG family transcriptional regulator n=1 Tax=Ammonifex thiophilus TaxID=444093 RepID=A0A3D8P658_9THEO|nr:DUF6364 family protein [Ammonifex thiophilus]RDV84820.1 CopG family transcriptional regulator [Ammonifex thiophilus]
MEYQNVTLSLPKDVLRRAKLIAVERGVSLSALLVQLLEDFTRQEDAYRKAQERHLALLNELNLGTGGEISWKREDVHER